MFGKKPDKPPPPPTTPTKADASIVEAGERANLGFSSFISTGTTGLARKAKTQKNTLIGGT